MADLRTRYLGLELGSPLVASASPLTGSLDSLARLEAAGAGAVVLPSLFEEELAEEARPGPGAYLSLVAQATAAGRPGHCGALDPGGGQPERRLPGRLGRLCQP